MEMVKVKVSELTGAALDWAVAKAAGLDVTLDGDRFVVEDGTINLGHVGKNYSPSTNWAQGGPLIDDYLLSVIYIGDEWMAGECNGVYPGGELDWDGADGFGFTPLIAICRALIRKTYGDEIEVAELLVEDGE